MEQIVIAGVLACIPAYIAGNKGYNWKLWWLGSWVLGYLTVFIGIILALCMRKRGVY